MGHGAEPCLSSIRFQIRLPHVPSTATQECGCRFNPEGMDDLCRHCPRHRARKNGTSRMGLVRPRKCLRPAASGAKRPFTGMSAFEGRTDLPFKYGHLTRSGHEQPDAFRGLSYTLQWWRLALAIHRCLFRPVERMYIANGPFKMPGSCRRYPTVHAGLCRWPGRRRREGRWLRCRNWRCCRTDG